MQRQSPYRVGVRVKCSQIRPDKMVIAALEGGKALADAGWREKRASQVLARPQFLPTRCQSMRRGGRKVHAFKNTPHFALTLAYTPTLFFPLLFPPSLFLFLRILLSFSFFLSSSLLYLLDEERMKRIVTMVVMDACSSTVCSVGVTHDCCYERGERKKMEISRGLS